jgi:membrane-associated phospholipid phosphatase
MPAVLRRRGLIRALSLTLAMAITACILFQSSQAEASDRDEKIIEAGDWLQILLPVTALGVTAVKKDWTGTKQLFYTSLASIGTVYVVKYTVARTRPDESEATSFPSGHTAGAFLGPTFIHRRYGWKYSVPFYFLAGFVGMSRVYADKHWAGDVMMGASVSMVSAFIFTTPYSDNLDVTAASVGGEPGVILELKW